MKLPYSSSLRLALAISSLFVLTALLAGVLTYVLQTRAMSNQLAEDVKGLAAGLAQIAAQGDKQDLIEQTEAHSSSVGDSSLIAVFVDGTSGEEFGNAKIVSPATGAHELLVGRDVTFKIMADNKPDSYFAYGIDTPLGMVVVGKDDAPLLENQRILLTTMGLGLGLALVLAIGLAFAIAGRTEGRIARIGRVLDAVGNGDYDKRIGTMTRDDLGHLASMVDQTLDRLVSGIEAIRQVTTDVAHDLRAPLGRLRIRLEPLALSEKLPPPIRHEMGSALSEIDAISATFDAILRLSRLESGAVQLAAEQVDVVEILEDVSDLFNSTAEGRYSITVNVSSTVLMCSCDRELITQAVVNLLHNSVKHSSHPVHITLTARTDGSDCVISVGDDGPGIPVEDRDRVLKRFVRLDASRRTPGTGLGLSLVAAIAERHGARLELLDNQPGLLVNIRLPSSR